MYITIFYVTVKTVDTAIYLQIACICIQT